MKKFVSPSVLAIASLSAASLLSSCVIYDDGGYGYGNQGGYSRPPANYGYQSSRPPAGYGYQSGPVIYQDQRSSPYYNNTPFNRYRTSQYRDPHYGHDHRDHYGHGHEDHHRNDSRGNNRDDDDLVHRPGSYRIAGGSTGSKTKPQGYHSVDWYKSRGYDVNKLTLKNEKGQTYKKGR